MNSKRIESVAVTETLSGHIIKHGEKQMVETLDSLKGHTFSLGPMLWQSDQPADPTCSILEQFTSVDMEVNHTNLL